jgi:hypothetical protein
MQQPNFDAILDSVQGSTTHLVLVIFLGWERKKIINSGISSFIPTF